MYFSAVKNMVATACICKQEDCCISYVQNAMAQVVGHHLLQLVGQYVSTVEYIIHGPLTRYVKLRVAHAPGMPGTFSPPPTSEETASWRWRHASPHVRDARAVMHVGIANPRWPGKTFPAFSAHAQPTVLRIWQEAHICVYHMLFNSMDETDSLKRLFSAQIGHGRIAITIIFNTVTVDSLDIKTILLGIIRHICLGVMYINR